MLHRLSSLSLRFIRALLLVNLIVLVLAGATGQRALAAPSAWRPTANMMTPRQGHTATLLLNGKVLVAGGSWDFQYQNPMGFPMSSAELYDPETGTWTVTGSMNDARVGHAAVLLSNGKVLVTGSAKDQKGYLASSELYDPATGAWTETGSLHSPRRDPILTLLPDGKVLATGGIYDFMVNTAEVYDPSTGIWTLVESMHQLRYLHTATLLQNGKVLVVGSAGDQPNEIYDPATQTWENIPPLLQARYSHTATLLPDGKVLIAGGLGSSYGPDYYLNRVELYDPTTNTFTPAASMIIGRGSPNATLLPDGKVLVEGGFDDVLGIKSAEVYDPATDQWALVEPMSVGRVSHTATLLPSGQVLVTGGIWYESTHGTAELYGPFEKANQVITFAPLEDQVYGAPDMTLQASASSGMPVTFSISEQSACTLSGNTIHLSGAGICAITATQAGDGNYNPAEPVERSFNILKLNQVISFDPLPDKTFGSADFIVNASASSGLPVTFSISEQSACTITENTIHLSGAGSCTVIASQAGNSTYNPAIPVSQPFTIDKAMVVIQIAGLFQTYDGNPKPVSVITHPGNLPTRVTYTGIDGTPGGPSQLPPIEVGTYQVTVEIIDPNYQGSATDVLVISRPGIYLPLITR